MKNKFAVCAIIFALVGCGGNAAPTVPAVPTLPPTSAPAPTATAQAKPTEAPKATSTPKPPEATATPDKKVWTKEDVIDKEGNIKVEATIQYLKESGFPNIKVGYDKEGVVTGTDKIRIVVVSTEPGDYPVDVYDRAAELLGNAMRKLEMMPSFAGLKDEHGNIIAGTRTFFQVSGPVAKLVLAKLQETGLTDFDQDSHVDIYVRKFGKTILEVNSIRDLTTNQNKLKVDYVGFDYARMMWNVVGRKANSDKVGFEIGVSGNNNSDGVKAMEIAGKKNGY